MIPASRGLLRLWLLPVALLFWAAPASAQDPFAAQRRQMVQSQIAARGVRDPRVLAAMAAVRRHLFVPPALAPLAYADHPLPIGEGQTISQPFIVAYMSQLLALKGHEKVLEIGTGSGYQSAVLAKLAASVYSIEIVPALYRAAKERLARLGYGKVHLRLGDGYQGWPRAAPFDAIIITAAPPKVPPKLVAQLAPGGRMVLPLGPAGGVQRLVLISKDAAGRVSRRNLDWVRFVPMVHPKDARPGKGGD